ncbi:MAG: LytTR family transcriptional regulator [Mogibacterium sp.]|nr:LytTR family transcriptional regulator [Mogibacterium sp.]
MKKNLGTIDNEDRLPEYISVISASQCARIRIDDIECIEQEGRKLHILTAKKDYSIYENIGSVISSLIERPFYRPMKGLIINFDHVRDITGSDVNFISGQVVSMGKNTICKTRQAYRRYLLRYPPYTNCVSLRVAEIPANLAYEPVKRKTKRKKAANR